MNFKDYMTKVEEMLSLMTAEEKTAVLRNLLRGVEEKSRADALRGLKREPQDISFKKEMEDLKMWREEVESGEIHFMVSGYEDYEEAPWGEEYYEAYEDPERIGLRYQQYILLAEKLLYGRRYKEALKIYEILVEMIFYAYSEEYGDLVEVPVDQAVEEELIKTNHRKNLLHLLYTYDQVYTKDKRCRKIYKVLEASVGENLKIDEFFSLGPEELTDREDFLEEWIHFLSSNAEDYAGDLLCEAADLKGRVECLVQTAREVGTVHPILYLKSSKRLNGERRYQEAEVLAAEAMEKLPVNLIMRSEIAETVYTAAVGLNDRDTAKKYLKESYRSNTSPLGFLALCGQLEEMKELKEAAKYAQSLPAFEELKIDETYGHWSKNRISPEEKEAILFFSGHWDPLYEQYKDNHTPLGWSMHTKGIILPLFLLAMYSDDELEKAGTLLWAETLHRLGRDYLDEEKMSGTFTLWRQKYQMSEEEKEKYFPWIKEELTRRIASIVENSYRKSYHKAALLVGTLGEVLESRGEKDAKLSLMAFYKKKYSRRRAFREELDRLQ